MSYISESDVVWAYKVFLGRKPESTTVVRQWMSSPNLAAMIEGMSGTEEFRNVAYREAVRKARRMADSRSRSRQARIGALWFVAGAAIAILCERYLIQG